MGHMVSEGDWSRLTGDKHDFYFLDSSISQTVSKMLRHRTCYRKFGVNTLGYSSLTEVYELVRDSRTNLDRIRRLGNQGGVTHGI